MKGSRNSKSEARAEHSAGINPKPETNSNDRKTKFKMTDVLKFGLLGFEICFELVRGGRFAQNSNFEFLLIGRFPWKSSLKAERF